MYYQILKVNFFRSFSSIDNVFFLEWVAVFLGIWLIIILST